MVTTKHCCYGVCRNDSRYGHTDRMKKVFFIRFPKPHLDRAKAERWVNACRRDTYICSLHFIGENGPTTETPDPVIATATPSQVTGREGLALGPLDLTGFSLYHLDKGRRLSPLPACPSVRALHEVVGKGMIVIVPHTDLPIPGVRFVHCVNCL